VLTTLVALAVIAGGGVTAAKGLVVWLLAGLLTAGLLWPFSALLLATPESLWARTFYGEDKLLRAEQKHKRRRRLGV
jgi:hypothetical protein